MKSATKKGDDVSSFFVPATRRLGTAQTRRHHHHPKPLPLFAFVYFLLLWGKATGRTGGAAPPSLSGGARRGRTGARAGQGGWVVWGKMACGVQHRRPWRPEGGRKREGVHAPARRARGERADPHGQGERGRGRERPRISWDGGAA